MRSLLAIAAALAVAGCAEAGLEAARCHSDNDCAAGHLCFPEGCADPGKDIVIEVTANTRTGHHAQDFFIPQIAVTQDVQLFAPISLVGEVAQRSGSGNTSSAVPYTSPVTISLVGESDLIPGITRRYEATFTAPERGAYSLFVGAGRFTVTATPADRAIPPAQNRDVTVVPGQRADSNFLFPAQTELVPLVGRLLKRYAPGTPAVEIAVTQTQMELQAIDPLSRRALSQRAAVSSGFAGSTGDFTLFIDPSVKDLETFALVATPKDPLAPVPSKVFAVHQPFPQGVTLELGDYGSLVTSATGTVLDAAKRPLAGAKVVLEGTVNGGGTFRTATVQTAADGTFTVSALPSAPDGSYTLTVVPAEGSPSGLLQTSAKVLGRANESGKLIEPDTFHCPARVKVTGTLLRPDGRLPASEVQVVAEPLEAIEFRPLPTQAVETLTDQEGRLVLYLDPARYRLDFIPGDGLPRRSRVIDVSAKPGAGDSELELTDFSLVNGRRVTGTITAAQVLIDGATSAPNAFIRFFRVTPVDGRTSTILLGQTVADERGRYSVLLPTR